MTIEQHRNNNDEISRKYGDTTVGTLRKIYGSSFAVGHLDTAMLRDVMDRLHETSLSQLFQDQGDGKLDHKVRQAALD
jgi:hypothetical protein